MRRLSSKQVAIKILEKDKIQDQEDFDRIAREICYLKQLQHKNIIQIFEIIETSEELYIVMENAPGGELFNYIVENKKLIEQEAAWFLVQLVDAMEHIHSFEIAHRDLKPENLLLAEGNLLKVIDFGLSNSYKETRTLQSGCGSPCYAAPEMILGKKYEGALIDIWSTGIIVYAMVCGYLPFEDDDNDKIYRKILDCKLDFPDHLSETCKDLIIGILTVDQKKRFRFEDIKEHEFYKMGLNFKKMPVVPEVTLANSLGQATLQKMVEVGFDKKEVAAMVKKNKHNNITTTFKLLYMKLARVSGPGNPAININISSSSKIENININISNNGFKEDVSLFDEDKTFTESKGGSERKLIIEGKEVTLCENADGLNGFRQKINASIHYDPVAKDHDNKPKLPKLRVMDEVKYMKHRSPSVAGDYTGELTEDKQKTLETIGEVVKEVKVVKEKIGGTPNRMDVKKLSSTVATEEMKKRPETSKKLIGVKKEDKVQTEKRVCFLVISVGSVDNDSNAQ